MITVYHYVCDATHVHIITNKECGITMVDNNEDYYDFIESFKLDVGRACTGFNMAYDKNSAWQGDNNLIEAYTKEPYLK
tara:strand:- start:602 stop:838 length:237 start_codon:yes stop_codon:yes gene_type:complete